MIQVKVNDMSICFICIHIICWKILNNWVTRKVLLDIISRSTGDDCKSGKVRLVDGETENEGRVEYCYDNRWAPVCSLNSYTASLMCQKLRYTQYTCKNTIVLYIMIHQTCYYTGGTIFNDQRFGRSNNQSNLNYIYCDSGHTDLDDCYVYNKGSSCYISTSTCGTEYGLRCYS